MSVIYNHDTAALCRSVRRISAELYKSVSSGTSGMNSFDQARCKANVAASRSLLAWVNSQPDLDLPESHPNALEVSDPAKYPAVESDSINLALDICYACEVEILNSSSAREAAGMNKFDSGRLGATLDKIDSLVDKHIAIAEPVDLPESSPSEPLSGAGAKGTNP